MDNINHRGKGKTCLGFGKTEGKCTNQAVSALPITVRE